MCHVSLQLLCLHFFSFQWFSSYYEEGHVYFFEENSNKSSWTLPDSSNAGCDVSNAEGMK
jgi:hypothetical protein